MTIDISQFFKVFFDEAEELLAEKERLLLGVDVDAPDAEDLNAIFRTAHSIKGGASTFGLTDMTEVTHILESLLDRIRKGEMALTGVHVDAFLAAKDILKMQLDGHRNGAPVDQDAVADVRMMLQELSQDVVAPAAIVAGAIVPAGGRGHRGAGRRRTPLPYRTAEGRTARRQCAGGRAGPAGARVGNAARRRAQRHHRHDA